MGVTTRYRIAEQVLRIINGGDISAASEITIRDIMIGVGQVANQVLKGEFVQSDIAFGETIPNGAMLCYYEGIAVQSWKGRCRATLPVKPIRMRRNMGVWSIRLSDDPTNEFIPIEMGQFNLIQSQPMLNDLLGQVGYEVFGDKVVFTKDITVPSETTTVDMQLVLLDINQYGDYDPLPILPEQEYSIIKELIALYSGTPTPDKLVDSTTKAQKGVPVNQQKQS